MIAICFCFLPLVGMTSSFWSIHLAHAYLTYCNIILSVHTLCFTTRHYILNKQFMNYASWNHASLWDFQDFLKSHYSHKPVKVFHFSHSSYSFIGCFEYVIVTKSNLWVNCLEFVCCWIHCRTGIMLFVMLFLYVRCLVLIYGSVIKCGQENYAVRSLWEILFQIFGSKQRWPLRE